MPLHRQRIVPKKINKTTGLVNLNHNRIPSLFVSLVAIFMVAGGTIWLIGANLSTKPAPQVAAVREKRDGSIDVDPNNAKVQQQIEDQQKVDTANKNQTVETPVIQTDQTQTEDVKPVENEIVRIKPSEKENENILFDELDCSVTYSKTAPVGLKTVSDSTSFWIPNTNCKNKELKAIQIVSSKTKPTFSGVQIESLDQDTEYALFYWKDNSFKTDIQLDNYLVPLTRFLSNGKLYFNVKEAYDKLQLNNKDTYYLAGNCNGESSGACVLWGLPANGSLVSLLTDKGLANTATGQENNLQKGQTLRFAKTQDRNNRLALILKKSADKIQLIYVDASKNYSIDEVRSYDKDTAGYTKYFR
jgi:hypothetical protein